jgi:hypothetical protein
MSNRKDRFRKWLEVAGDATDDEFYDILQGLWEAPLLHVVPDPSLWTDEDVLLYSEHVFDACGGAVWSGDDDDD